MRKSSHRPGIKRITAFLVLLAGVPSAWADADPNKLLAFKKIFLAPVTDNLEGTFREPVEQAYKEIFDRNPRFEIVTDAAQADSTIRTDIRKKTSGMDVTITLVLNETGETFSTEKFTIPAAATGHEARVTTKDLLKAALKRVPFAGTVTGRDGDSLTFDIGSQSGLTEGDTVQISRVDNIKRHPLLKSIVDIQLVPSGSAEIDDVEQTIAFGHVTKEITGETIQRLYKVTAIEAKPKEEPKKKEKVALLDPNLPEEELPELGYLALGPTLGLFQGETSRNAGSTTLSGSSFSPGGRFFGELWLTKRWYLEAQFALAYASYTQSNAATQVQSSSFSTTTQTFGLSGGYKHYLTPSIYGPHATVKLGYHSFTWDTPSSATDILGPKSYSGLNLGLGGTFPLAGGRWGVTLGVNVLLLASFTEEGVQTPLDGTQEESTTGAGFFVGGYHFFDPKLALRAGFQFESYSTDFTGGTLGVASSSTSQKQISFSPSLLFYF